MARHACLEFISVCIESVEKVDYTAAMICIILVNLIHKLKKERLPFAPDK